MSSFAEVSDLLRTLRRNRLEDTAYLQTAKPYQLAELAERLREATECLDEIKGFVREPKRKTR
jgi:hypothetical protein